MVDASPDRWESCYIGYAAGIYSEEFDTLLLEIVRPLLAALDEERLISRRFFARLGEGGPHLRLRMEPVGSGARLREVVADHLQSRDDARLTGFSWVPYEPETERYGGRLALAESESFFCTSTAAVSQILETGGIGRRQTRLGVGALLMSSTCAPFVESADELSAAFRRYALTYFGRSDVNDVRIAAIDAARSMPSSFVAALRESASTDPSLEPPFDLIARSARRLALHCSSLHERGALVAARDAPFPSWSVVSSQMHMTNNRLGISRDEESYLAALIAEAFASERVER